MSIRKFRVECQFEVEIELDASKFDEAFMEEFRASFYPYFDVEDHAKHLAQLEARDMLDGFVEGYGPIDAMGIKGRVLWADQVVLSPEPQP